MAKVQSPLYANFKEAFSDILVFQRNRGNVIKVRTKVKHPKEPTSAHTPGRSENWAQAVDDYDKNIYPNKTLLEIVALEAISPDSPKNLRQLLGYSSDYYNSNYYNGNPDVYSHQTFNSCYYQTISV